MARHRVGRGSPTLTMRPVKPGRLAAIRARLAGLDRRKLALHSVAPLGVILAVVVTLVGMSAGTQVPVVYEAPGTAAPSTVEADRPQPWTGQPCRAPRTRPGPGCQRTSRPA